MKNQWIMIFLAAWCLTSLGCSDADTGSEGTNDVGNVSADSVLFGDTAGTADTLDTSTASDVALSDSGPAKDTAPSADTGGGVAKTDPQIATVPESHAFSYISPLANALFKQITIHNLGSAPLDITAIAFPEGSSPDFDMVLIPPLPKTVPPNKSTMVNVRFRELAGGDGTLRIESGDPAQPVLDIPLTSSVKATINVPEPCVALTPNQLSFGSVVRGQKKTLQASLQNCGATQPLVLKKIVRSTTFFFELTQEFQIDPEPALPLTIAPGQSLPVNVTYAPKLAGPDSGYFEFQTDDPNEPGVQLDVTGVGLEPAPEDVGLTIKLYWDTDKSDVDSHLVYPGGTFFDCDLDCHYGNASPDWGQTGNWIDDPFLDVDDVDGFGPEYTNVSEPVPGTYRFIVHYFDDSYGGSGSNGSQATVELQSYGQTIATFGPTFLDSTNYTWDVFDVEWMGPNTPPVVTTLGNTYKVSNGDINICLPFFP
jgi:hypothetical protein